MSTRRVPLRSFALPLLLIGAAALLAACSGNDSNNGASGASGTP